jgi:hypothetical protein
MLSVEMHTQVYREQYQDAVRTAEHDRLVRSVAQPGAGRVTRNVASWLSSRLQRQSALAVCCAQAACC